MDLVVLTVSIFIGIYYSSNINSFYPIQSLKEVLNKIKIDSININIAIISIFD